MALERVVRTARFGARKAREVYAVEGLSGVVRRSRNWNRKRRAAAQAPTRLPRGPLPPHPHWHQHVLSIAERGLPQCYHYRVQQKREICEHLGVPFDDVGLEDPADVLSRLQLASMLIVYRLGASPALDSVLAEARRLRVPIVYEVDDLVYRRDVTAANPNLETLPRGLRSAVIRGSVGYAEALAQAETNLASTPALLEDMTMMNGRPGFVVENGIDATMLEIAEGLAVEPRPSVSASCVVTYGSGSRAHDHDFALAAPALARWLAATPTGRLKVLGPVRIPEPLAALRDRITTIPQTLPYGEYLRELHGSTIAIAPLTGDHFNAFKSQVKYLEAGLVGVPFIASPMVYEDYVEDGRTGIIARDDEAWFHALATLAGDAALRGRLAAAARDHVRQWELDKRPRQQLAALISSLSPTAELIEP